MAMGKAVRKPHAVCIPHPSQSHIGAMLKLAKLLHHKGFYITFVHTEYNYKRLLKSRGPKSLDGSPDFKFETIPDGLPPAENDDVTQDVFQLFLSTAKNFYRPFVDLIRRLNNKASVDDEFPPVTFIISDAVMSTFTVKAAEELGIPDVLFWTMSALTVMCFSQFPQLRERGYTPLKDASCFTNGYMENTIDWIPGISSVRLKDIPTVIWTTDPNDEFVDCLVKLIPWTLKGAAVILNTFEQLEHGILEQFSSMMDHLYTVGPIHLLLKEVQKDDHSTEAIQSNLWKEDDSCIEWLNSKKAGSVAYVNFGSITVMTENQLVEFAMGLANSMQYFLWIIRPDLVNGGPIDLPPEFFIASKDRGMLATWCNQEVVLSHPSVGAFLTHCGWNSVLESLSAGVPMICWPFFADQQTNCLSCCSYWGVGVEIDNNVNRKEVENVVRDLMEGEKGKEIKKKTLEWKNKAEEAIKHGGSSYLNLDKMIEEVLLAPKI
ncbi:7-deoxyloganetin glucosyltransferase-like [Coffea eugenioides]|uniref:7-deoxyloganetin glucosyltransferase-like n=1 Tax=Coffea eugenioides TaxID=49369 RepID=UPI000F614833|nr:7-deoxyloganetin glucosyltransferase-like [Coffea eugenioides]